MTLDVKATIGYGWMIPANIANKISNEFRYTHEDCIRNLSEYEEEPNVFVGKILSEISWESQPQILDEDKISLYFDDKIISELYDLFEEIQYDGSPHLYFFTVIT